MPNLTFKHLEMVCIFSYFLINLTLKLRISPYGLFCLFVWSCYLTGFLIVVVKLCAFKSFSVFIFSGCAIFKTIL